jgi:hypothetical protein
MLIWRCCAAFAFVSMHERRARTQCAKPLFGRPREQTGRADK